MQNLAGWSSVSPAAIPGGIPPPRNRLLAALAPHERAALRPHLSPVALVSNQTLFAPGEAIGHVYFVEQGVLSVMADTGADDAGIEVGMIGPEGVAGFPCLFGHRAVAFHHIRVQMPGSALRLPADEFRRLLEAVPPFRERCLGYVDAVIAQTSQTGACAGRHRLPERCASWLLEVCDRAEAADFPLTHESISTALGVRRAGVTMAMGALQDAGLVRSGKGRTTVLDHAGLERAACGCYRLVRGRFDQLLHCA